MNSAETVLVELIKSSLFGHTASFPEDTDWEAVLAEAKAQTVVPLCLDAVPGEFRAVWSVCAAQSEAHFMRALYEQTKLVNLLNGAAVPFVIIKGNAAAVYYNDAKKRTTGDIDILVPQEYFDFAYSLLDKNGYEFIMDFGDDRDYSFTSGGVHFDLHKRYSDLNYDIEDYLIKGINNARTLSLYGNSFPTLPEAENGLVLLDHIRHHLLGGLGLRQIIDFMMFVNAVDEKTFEDEYLPLFERVNLATLARVIIKMCKEYLGFEKAAKWCESADRETCSEFFDTVLSSGNFGRKNPYVERPLRSLTMSVKKNGFFKTLQAAGMENCELFKKHKLLRPFAWLYQLFRYIKRGFAALLKGDRFSGDISSGKSKADFYERLGIK